MSENQDTLTGSTPDTAQDTAQETSAAETAGRKVSRKRKIFTIIFWAAAILIWTLLAMVYHFGMEEIRQQEAGEAAEEADESGIFVPDHAAFDEISTGRKDLEAWRMDPANAERIASILQYMAETDMNIPSVENAACAAAYGDLERLKLYDAQGFSRWSDPSIFSAAASQPFTDVMEFLISKAPNVPGSIQHLMEDAIYGDSVEMVKVLAEHNVPCPPVSGNIRSREMLEYLLDNLMPGLNIQEQTYIAQNILSYGDRDLAEFFSSRFPDVDLVRAPGSIFIAAGAGNINILQWLISCGADTAVLSANGQTPADWAVRFGHFDAARLLLSNNSYLTFTDLGAIQLCLAADNPESLSLLLEAGISPDSLLPPPGQSVLVYAVSNDMSDFAGLLLQKGASPHMALRYGKSPEMIKMLLEAGADPNAKDQERRTSAFYLCDAGREILQLLKDYGMEIDARDDSNNTPLMFAAMSGDHGSVKFFISAGADVNAVNNSGESPLHFAAAGGSSGIISILAAAGADLNALANLGRSPLETAAESGHWEAAERLLQLGAKCIENGSGDPLVFYAAAHGSAADAEMLISAGADAGKIRPDGGTVLHHVLEGFSPDKAELIRVFVSAGVNIAAEDINGDTVMHKALQKGEYGIARMLITLGANVNSRNDAGLSPLHLAADHTETAADLIAAGAIVNMPDSNGMTPLHLAARSGNTSTVSLLLEHGADRELLDRWRQKAADLASKQEIKLLLEDK